MRRALAAGLVGVLAAGAGCARDLRDGDPVALEGNLVQGLECPLSLDTPDGRFAVLDDLPGLRAGDRVRVRGEYAAGTVCLLRGIHVASVRRLPPEHPEDDARD